MDCSRYFNSYKCLLFLQEEKEIQKTDRDYLKTFKTHLFKIVYNLQHSGISNRNLYMNRVKLLYNGISKIIIVIEFCRYK